VVMSAEAGHFVSVSLSRRPFSIYLR
jgi:hypothetical protein